jgi:hypothetical protein
MSVQVENPITLLDEVKLQAQVLIPILRTLRMETRLCENPVNYRGPFLSMH